MRKKYSESDYFFITYYKSKFDDDENVENDAQVSGLRHSFVCFDLYLKSKVIYK